MDPLDIFRYFDPFDRAEGAISTFINADWRSAWRSRGPLGLFTEFVSCLTAHNSPTIRVPRGSGWNGQMVENVLARYGIAIWDRGASGAELYFCVKRRQVAWAEYVLMRAGVPLNSILKERRNTEWAARHPGKPVPAWRDKK